MVATSAFGVGVNIPHIQLVIHKDYPYSLRNLLQQGGRGGRSLNETAEHIILYNGDVGQHQIEDYLYDSNSNEQNWDKKRRDIAAVKLSCQLYQCRRVSFVTFGVPP